MGHLHGPPQMDLRDDAPLKLMGAGKGCLLPATGGETLRVPGGPGFARAGVIPRQLDLVFLGHGLGNMEG